MGLGQERKQMQNTYEIIGYHLADFVTIAISLKIDDYSLGNTKEDKEKFSSQAAIFSSMLKRGEITKAEFYAKFDLREADVLKRARELNVRTAQQVNEDAQSAEV